MQLIACRPKPICDPISSHANTDAQYTEAKKGSSIMKTLELRPQAVGSCVNCYHGSVTRVLFQESECGSSYAVYST